MITATAPGCCRLVGSPTDLLGGSVLACSTRERARCTLNRDAKEITITVSRQSQVIQTVADLALVGNESLNVARAVLTALEVTPGQTPPFHLQVQTDIPPAAGLAGTAAMLATITGCLLTHLELRLNLYQIAELVHKIEYDYLGVACGFQDHYMTVFGGLTFLDFRDKYSPPAQEPHTPFATVERLDNYMNDVPFVAAQAASRPTFPPLHRHGHEGDSGVKDGHQEIARLSRAAKRALLSCDWAAFGDLMNRSHILQRDLGSGGEIEERLIAAALVGGADGATLAGDGGLIVALTREPGHTVEALRAAGANVILYPRPGPGLTIALEVTVP